MTTQDIPTLTTIDQAVTTLDALRADNEWVSVFWDRGWGDSGQTADITIIVDGDGQNPKARITGDVYKTLTAQGIVEPNSLQTFKARRVHNYRAPAPVEKTEPSANDIAEQIIRDIMTAHPDLPIRADFWRGIRTPSEVVETPAADAGWFVLLIPGHSDVAMSAQEPTFLGPNIIGGGIADCLTYPRTGGDVDVVALAGPQFRDVLMDAIRAKAADIAAVRTAA